MIHDNIIRSRPCPVCPICGSRGSQLYLGLTDQIFDAPGVWDMRKCNNPDCGTLWLDPMPVEADLSKLYTGYYTHDAKPKNASHSGLGGILDRFRVAYLHIRFGYEPASHCWLDRLLASAVCLHPAWRESINSSVFHLPAQPGARLLEIGCGSGEALILMQKRGWRVTGLDFDEGAVRNARSKDLDVHIGSLSSHVFASESFDAVVMSHVIEHVMSPGQLLRECRRIMKKEGILVSLTPNADSPMHARYGRHWRGIEAPRHLQIFTARSLNNLAKTTGYNAVNVFTTLNGYVYQDLASRQLAAGKKHTMGNQVPFARRIPCHIKALALGWLQLLASGREGEEAVLVCRK